MDEKLFSARMAEYKSAVDKYLDACLLDMQCASYHRLTDSMHYSLTAGGKRLRAILVLEFCRICGGDVEKALPVACGVEMLHTYSLIHDDLPVMDNDDLRRGKPSNHKVFGECTATLAGDALQAEAFRTILSTSLPAEVRAECARLLAEAGYDEKFGARPLRRAIQRQVEDALSEEIISGRLKLGDSVQATVEDGKLKLHRLPPAPALTGARLPEEPVAEE